ncbi:hypothetical protein ACJX0J_018262, partial [Zea mays]
SNFGAYMALTHGFVGSGGNIRASVLKLVFKNSLICATVPAIKIHVIRVKRKRDESEVNHLFTLIKYVKNINNFYLNLDVTTHNQVIFGDENQDMLVFLPLPAYLEALGENMHLIFTIICFSVFIFVTIKFETKFTDKRLATRNSRLGVQKKILVVNLIQQLAVHSIILAPRDSLKMGHVITSNQITLECDLYSRSLLAFMEQ